MSEMENVARIPEFYSGRSIFITGFSGFMGKILVEKLLWSCPDIHHIFVLLRDKRGLTLEERLDKIIQSDVFDRVRNRIGDELWKKLIPVKGDASQTDLGISEEDRRTLCEEVSIIFHCAASVRFDDPLTVALDINVKGTKSMVDLALNMPKLIVFAHMSTAYSNCNRFDIEEKLYPPMADWRQTLLIRDKIDERVFCTMNQKFSNHMPNTYVFAKSLGEHIVNEYSDRLPIIIFRPSIVVSTMFEPFPGWSDNLNGPGGILLGYGTGVVRTSLTDSRILADYVPVDLAIRGLIVLAYIKMCDREEGAQVYNWCVSDRSVKYSDITVMGKRVVKDVPMKYLLWRPTNHMTSNKLLFYVYFILFQALPAVFADFALRLVGREPLLIKIQRKIYIAMNALEHFTLNCFHFHNKKGYDLIKRIPDEDLAEFNYMIEQEDVDEYKSFYDAAKYAQKKYFKMTKEDEIKAKRLFNILDVADRVVKTSFWIYLAYYIYKNQIIQNVVIAVYDFICDF